MSMLSDNATQMDAEEIGDDRSEDWQQGGGQSEEGSSTGPDDASAHRHLALHFFNGMNGILRSPLPPSWETTLHMETAGDQEGLNESEAEFSNMTEDSSPDRHLSRHFQSGREGNFEDSRPNENGIEGGNNHGDRAGSPVDNLVIGQKYFVNSTGTGRLSSHVGKLVGDWGVRRFSSSGTMAEKMNWLDGSS